MEGMLAALEGSTFALVLRTWGVLYPLISGLHILGIALLVGSALAFDMRLAGLWRASEARAAVRMMAPTAAAGLGLVLATGFLLFSVRASVYAQNPAMLIKWGLILLGLANVVLVHLVMRRMAIKNRYRPMTLRVGALVSAAVWIGAILAGRWIAFTDQF